MIASLIRTLGRVCASYPQAPGHPAPGGAFSRLKVALVADHFTECCLSVECRVKNVTPDNFPDVLGNWRPDLLFVESVFHGHNGCWRYELAEQPRWLRQIRPRAIYRLVEYAKERGIPTVFWNKDDGAFFQAFAPVARVFDHVFTTDSASLAAYRELLPPGVSARTLMMACQPRFHSFTGFHFQTNAACFTGSYYRGMLPERRAFLDMLFREAEATDARIHVFDRNHDRLLRFFSFRFPERPGITVHPRVGYTETARLYKSHALSINVNSVVASETMCSRRLLEILACGGIALTNATPCVRKYFQEYCHVVSTEDEARELFARLAHGPDRKDKEKAAEGARYVLSAHTWEHRLQEISAVVPF